MTDTLMRDARVAAALATRDPRGVGVSRVESLQVIPVAGIAEVTPGDEIAVMVADAAARPGDAAARPRLPRRHPEDRVEGREPARAARSRRLRGARVSSRRKRFASCAAAATSSSARPRTASCARTPESISRTSTTGYAALLPVDSDRSAHHIRNALGARHGVDVAVIVSDTFGRPWRLGLTDVAIGVAGIAAVVDLPRHRRRPRPRSSR